jgi:alkanesulfonate monooxygenase
VTSFEPFTLLSALTAATEGIGLIATASTTFDEPYHIARRFASLDHISGGRAGWNIVTTSNPNAALNFGRDDTSRTQSVDSRRPESEVPTGSACSDFPQ